MLDRVPRSFPSKRRQARSLAGLCAALAMLSFVACSGRAQGFLEPADGGVGGANGEPEPFACPSDCAASPCPILFIFRASEIFPSPGELKVFGEDQGWVYATVESGRTLIRMHECGPAREVQVLARTESAFADLTVGPDLVHAALSGGRIFRFTAEEWEPVLFKQFEMTAAPVLEPARNGAFLALTPSIEGVLEVALDGSQKSVADPRYLGSPRVVSVTDGVVAQRVSSDGTTAIVKLEDDGRREVLLAEGLVGELELLDARDKGVLFSRKLDMQTSQLDYISLSGGNTLELLRGPLAGLARWTELGVVYTTFEQNDAGQPVVRLREATAGLGSQPLEATAGRFLFDGVTSVHTSGRRTFITTDAGLLFRQTFRRRE